MQVLYLIEFLHQTTTNRERLIEYSRLYLIEFLHQTTTTLRGERLFMELYLIEFLHQTTTSVACPVDFLDFTVVLRWAKPQRKVR